MFQKTETSFDNEAYLIKYFKELIICHSIKRPPFCIDIFNNQTVVKVVNYITNTYLKHLIKSQELSPAHYQEILKVIASILHSSTFRGTMT